MKLPNGYGSVVKQNGRRRKPYIVKKTIGYHYDAEKDKQVQDYIIIGYAKTKAEGLRMLAEYNENPFDSNAAKMTFSDVYEEWSKRKFQTVSKSSINGYRASYKVCTSLYKKVFKDIKLAELQNVIDTCGKNYPTIRKVRILFNQLYEFAMKNDLCSKDYSTYVEIAQHKNKNPNGFERNKFEKKEVEMLWTMKDDPYYQIILMLLYNGTRITEFLNLKKEDVHLDEQYFDIWKSKTKNGIRKVPIADKVLPFYKSWYDANPSSQYLLNTINGERFLYRNYYDSYYLPLVRQLGIDKTPHCCRHTCISMLVQAGVDQTTIKKIVGHSSAMNMTEKVYTHLDIQTLVDAINTI